ncbi:MAG: MFS transporter [Halanaeroarchaeum sp.]
MAGAKDDETEWTGPAVEHPRRALGVVFAVVFVDLVGFGILIPIVPLYAEGFGASEFVVGLLIAAYSMTQFLAAPVLGRLSDRRGRRPILLLSLAGSVVAWTLFGLAQGLLLLFVARLLAGAMGGNIATAQAYVADLLPPEDRAKGLGLVGAAFGLGFVFGPALGGVFSSASVVGTARSLLPAFVPVTEFTLPSFVAAGISAANLLAAAVVLPETNAGDATVQRESRIDRLRSALENPALNGLIVAFFLFSIAFSAMESMFVLFTGDVFGYGPTVNGYILAYLGVVIAVVQGGLVGRLTDRYGERTIALIGVSLQFVGLLSLPFSPAIATTVPGVADLLPLFAGASDALVVLLVSLTILSLGNGFANVSLTTLVSMTAAEDRQGGAFGLTQSASSIARATGPVLAGVLYTAIGYWVPFVAGGLLMIPILGLLLTVIGKAVPVPE